MERGFGMDISSLPINFGKQARHSSERPWMRNDNRQPSPPGTSNIQYAMKGEPDFSVEDSNGMHSHIKAEQTDYGRMSAKQEHRGGVETEEEEEEKFFCGVCDHTSYSLEAYQEHVVSQQHVNRAARVFHFEVPTKKQIREENKDKEIHHCDICDVNCNGEICWTAHLQGAKHKKKEKQKQLEDEMTKAAQERGIPQGIGVPQKKDTIPTTRQEFMNFPEPLIGLEYVTEIQIPGEVPRFHCELCDAKFDNNLKFPHLIGAKHRLQVIKNRDHEWAKQIQASCEKRSELTQRLAQAAKKLEQTEGRQMINARSESVFANVVKAEDGGILPLMSETEWNNSMKEEPFNGDGLLPFPQSNQLVAPPQNHQRIAPPQNNQRIAPLQNNPSMPIPSLMSLGDGILPLPMASPTINIDEYSMNDEVNDNRGEYDVEETYHDHGEERIEQSKEQRERSSERRSDRKERSNERRSERREGSAERRRDRSSDEAERRRDRSSDERGRRGRSSERRFRRNRSNSVERRETRRPSRERSHQSRERSPRKFRSPTRDAAGPKDISEEIQDEMRRQQKRAEEKRRAIERKRRHEDRERKEADERKKRRREESSHSRDSRKSTPPPEAPKVLDEDTKRLVMQNLTELAKCCVTNEADAELALQVSNALTQALLQYRMRNMPASVLQSLGSATGSNTHQQQLPPQPPALRQHSPPRPPRSPPHQPLQQQQPRSLHPAMQGESQMMQQPPVNYNQVPPEHQREYFNNQQTQNHPGAPQHPSQYPLQNQPISQYQQNFSMLPYHQQAPQQQQLQLDDMNQRFQNELSPQTPLRSQQLLGGLRTGHQQPQLQNQPEPLMAQNPQLEQQLRGLIQHSLYEQQHQRPVQNLASMYQQSEMHMR